MKKMLALVLCAIMVMALLPTMVLAEEDKDISTTGLNLYNDPGAPAVKTTYKAGNGKVVWDPVMSGDPATVTSGTLTLDSAQIQLGYHVTTDAFFKLPNVPVKIELKGTSTFSTSGEGTGIVSNKSNFFYSKNSVELTGSGSIDSTTSAYFISTENTVTLNGVTHFGKIWALSAVLNDVTISEDKTLNLEDVSGQVTATNTVNNGTLEMKRKADTNADNAAIRALNLTGSGVVKMSDGTTNYYTNDGTIIRSIEGSMNFTLKPDNDGNWAYGTTLADNGYEFTGDKTTGYTLKLGNLIMDANDPGSAITLPNDGPVNVILTDGATTCINNWGGGSAIFFRKGVGTYPCTITGNGKLVLSGGRCPSLIKVCQPLTITGGDITIKNVFHPQMGIDAVGTELTIIGSRLSIAAETSAISADNLTLKNAKITNPEGAIFSPTSKTICDTNNNTVASVTISPIVVESVSVMPGTATLEKGDSKTFSATVEGENDPEQTVTWSVTGNNSTSTVISTSGVLTVGEDETATTLTVKAISTVNTAKSGTATVTVMTPFEIIKGQGGEWTKDSTNGLCFTADVDYSKFTGVSVDGTAISSDKYTSESGSTIVTLKTSYLKTLSNGQHTFRINFTDGYAETNFTVKAATNSGNPATGVNSQPMLWLGMSLLAGAGLAASFVLGRRMLEDAEQIKRV